MSRLLIDRLTLLSLTFILCSTLTAHHSHADMEHDNPLSVSIHSAAINEHAFRQRGEDLSSSSTRTSSQLPESNLLETILLRGNGFARSTWNERVRNSKNYDTSSTFVYFKNTERLSWEKFIATREITCSNLTESRQVQRYRDCLNYNGYHIDKLINKENTLIIYISEYVQIKDVTVSNFDTPDSPAAAYLNLLLQPYTGPALNPGQLRINFKEFEYKKIGYKPQAHFFKNKDDTYNTTLNAELHDDKIAASASYDLNQKFAARASAQWLTNFVAPGLSALDVAYHSADDEIFTNFYTPLHQFDFSTLEAAGSYSNSSVLEAHNVELASAGLKHSGRIYHYSDPDILYTQSFLLKNEQVRNNLSPTITYAQYDLGTVFKSPSKDRNQFEVNFSVITTDDELVPVFSSGLKLKSQENFEASDIKFRVNTDIAVNALFSKFSNYPISERLSLGGEGTIRGVSNSLFGSRQDPQDTGAEFTAAVQNEIEFPFTIEKKRTSVGLLNDYGVVDRGYGSGELLVSVGLFGRYQLGKNVMGSLEVSKNFNTDKIFHVGFSLKTFF